MTTNMADERHECPVDGTFSVYLSLFDNVTNNKELKQMVMNGKLNVALINPSLICDRFQVLTAATLAVHRLTNDKLATRNVHSEILYSLSPTKQISGAFMSFGINEEVDKVLVVEVTNTSSDIDTVNHLIKGDRVSLDKLGQFANHKDILKYYKIKDEEMKVGSLIDAIVARMNSKDFIKF